VEGNQREERGIINIFIKHGETPKYCLKRREERGRLREYDLGGEFDQSILYISVEISH
jgi:hypothetical protein